MACTFLFSADYLRCKYFWEIGFERQVGTETSDPLRVRAVRAFQVLDIVVRQRRLN